MKSKTIYEPVFKTNVTIFIEKDEKKAKKHCEKIIGESLDDMTFNLQAKTIDYQKENGYQMILVWLRTPEASLLAHELIHVVEYSFERKRIPFSIEASEVIAYYIEYLFNEFSFLVKEKSK